MATKPKLDADLSGTLVDQTDYRSKIGSLMYLTSSRPDIVQAICYCARYQARPTEKHLTEMPDPCRMHYYSQKTSGVNKFLGYTGRCRIAHSVEGWIHTHAQCSPTKTYYKAHQDSSIQKSSRIKTKTTLLAYVMAAMVPVAPEVGAAAVASPAGVLELDTHSSSEADPSESSPPPVSIAPMVSPFLCSDDSESDTEIPKRHVSPTPHDAMLTRWRSRVASRSSSPTTSIPEIPTAPILPAPSSEFPIAPFVAPPGIRQRQAILIRPGEDIPIGRLHHTHYGGPCRALTARKSVRPLPSHRLALRYTSHHLDHFTSRSSSSHSSSDHSSYGHSISGHSLSGHTPPDTTDADSSTPQRFVHPSLARTPWCSEAYLR
ncbi:hypothetical protein Tco_0488764 [Tanacetum coccineum]